MMKQHPYQFHNLHGELVLCLLWKLYLEPECSLVYTHTQNLIYMFWLNLPRTTKNFVFLVGQFIDLRIDLRKLFRTLTNLFFLLY